jgi:hypothetical protein
LPHAARPSASSPTWPRPIPTSALRCMTGASLTRPSLRIARPSASNPTWPRPILTLAVY